VAILDTIPTFTPLQLSRSEQGRMILREIDAGCTCSERETRKIAPHVVDHATERRFYCCGCGALATIHLQL
jgi:hypothetical protein